MPAAALDDPHPTWVSYYAVNANDGDWRHVTTYTLPAHSTVHITIYNWDSQTGPAQPVHRPVARALRAAASCSTASRLQAVGPDAASHIFAIPQLGISVPVQGIADSAKNPCSNAPCTLKQDHTTTTFTIHTGAPGYFRWQCFVPCAAGFIGGVGGPMSMVGYMDGFIKVV